MDLVSFESPQEYRHFATMMYYGEYFLQWFTMVSIFPLPMFSSASIYGSPCVAKVAKYVKRVLILVLSPLAMFMINLPSEIILIITDISWQTTSARSGRLEGNATSKTRAAMLHTFSPSTLTGDLEIFSPESKKNSPAFQMVLGRR